MDLLNEKKIIILILLVNKGHNDKKISKYKCKKWAYILYVPLNGMIRVAIQIL